MKFDNSFLYHKIKQFIRDEIGKRAENGKELRLESERDMADDLNVSRFSVNKAISELVAEGYLIKRRGKGVYIPPKEQIDSLENSSQSIVLIIPDTSVYFYGELSREVETIAYERKFKLVLCLIGNDPEKERNILAGIQNQSVKGIIAAPHLSGQNTDLYEKIFASGVPVILINRIHYSMEGLPHIIFDQGEGSYLGALHMMEHGRRHIIYIDDYPDSYLSQLRHKGLEKAVQERGLDLGRMSAIDEDFDTQLIERARDGRMDGIIAYNDLIAIRAMNVLIKNGFHIPAQVAVMGYDNSYNTEIALVPLTSVKFPKQKVARQAFDALMAQMERRGIEMKQVIATELIVRESTFPNEAE